MPAVQIRDVPPEVIAALKRRAVRHERSLEGELRHILSVIARQEPPSALTSGVGRLVTADVEDFARFAPEIEVIGLAKLAPV